MQCSRTPLAGWMLAGPERRNFGTPDPTYSSRLTMVDQMVTELRVLYWLPRR